MIWLSGRGAGAPNARMEAELSTWLRGLEPPDMPLALRVRTFADLRTEADRPRRPFRLLAPALSAVTSLGGIVFGAGLVLVLAVAGAALDQSAGGQGHMALGNLGGQSGLPAIGAGGFASAMDPVVFVLLLGAFLLLLVVSGLAGSALLDRRVWDVVVRMTPGQDEPLPLTTLPFRQSWRTIPRWTWGLGTLAVVLATWSVGWVLTRPTGYSVPEYAVGTYGTISGSFLIVAFACFIVAFAWRYPRRDRSGRRLIIGALGFAFGGLIFLTAVTFNLFPSSGFSDVASVLWIVAMAAALANRSGRLHRPPLQPATVLIGATFFLPICSLSLQFANLANHSLAVPLDLLPDFVFQSVSAWIVLVGLLAVLWIGLSTSRHGGSWTWRLVAAYGVLMLLSRLPYYPLLYANVLSGGSWGADGTSLTVLGWWVSLTTTLASISLLLALLGGLRPSPSDQDGPAPPEQPATATGADPAT